MFFKKIPALFVEMARAKNRKDYLKEEQQNEKLYSTRY